MEKDFEKYQSELGEKIPKVVFKRLYDLNLEKIPEKNCKRSPDYKVLDKEGVIIAHCEVKSCVDSTPSRTFNPIIFDDKTLLEISEKGEKSNQNYFSKLMKHHQKAVKQLDDYQKLPTLLIFVSFDMTDSRDMDKMLQEYAELYSSSPMADVYILLKVHQKDMPSENFDLYEIGIIHNDTDQGKNFVSKYMSEPHLWPLFFSIKM